MMADLQDKQTIYEYPEFQQFVDAILANQPWRKDDNEDELMRWLLGARLFQRLIKGVCGRRNLHRAFLVELLRGLMHSGSSSGHT